MTRLTAIEEMAGMTLLCSDKTGTLTLNTMVIQVLTHHDANSAAGKGHGCKCCSPEPRHMEPNRGTYGQRILR